MLYVFKFIFEKRIELLRENLYRLYIRMIFMQCWCKAFTPSTNHKPSFVWLLS